jgi:hypothetical protein
MKVLQIREAQMMGLCIAGSPRDNEISVARTACNLERSVATFRAFEAMVHSKFRNYTFAEPRMFRAISVSALKA